ncbi:MAG TPA: hypothetical protein VGB98_00385 [Pyrinomonadaceae bacterium]|jgi:hypothetical protein
MKTLLVITCTCLFFAACARPASGRATDELLINVRLTTGERSKDSGSQTTTITVERDEIVLARTFGGSSRRSPTPPRKVYKLSPSDKLHLRKLIESNNLLVTDSIRLPQPSSNYRYFEISVGLTLGGKKGAIDISGTRSAVEVREEQLYRSTLTLVEGLYRIMNGHDKGIHFEELLLDRTGR